MHALIAVVSWVIVLGLGVWGVEYIFGDFSWVVYCVGGFFGLMALMARVNAT